MRPLLAPCSSGVSRTGNADALVAFPSMTQRVLLKLPNSAASLTPNSILFHDESPQRPFQNFLPPATFLPPFPTNEPATLSKIPRKSTPSSPIMGSFQNQSNSPADNSSNNNDCIPEDAKTILRALASKWEDTINPDQLQVIPLKGAMTNEVFQIKWPTTHERSRKVLVRIYGKGVDIFFDRENEIKTFEFVSQKGQGPRLLARFSNGRIEEFIRARTLSAPDLRDPEISALIAVKMREFHELDMPALKTVLLWDRLRNWLNAAKNMCSPEEAKAFSLDNLQDEISGMQEKMTSDNQQIGFCHNDLQYGNIMIDEETRSITIIDYEYASYNPVAFDIANHFCEMAADYHIETPHILDYSKYPDVEERKRFVQIYLSNSGDQPNAFKVDQLVQEIEKYTLASHLFWGLWGIISEHVNKIDFDYSEYARQRFQQYWLKKPDLLR